jgi:hypothetical protein
MSSVVCSGVWYADLVLCCYAVSVRNPWTLGSPTRRVYYVECSVYYVERSMSDGKPAWRFDHGGAGG